MVIRFYLKFPATDVKSPVYVSLAFHNRRLRMGTGEKVLPADWHNQRMRRNVPGAALVNMRLDEIEGKLSQAYRTVMLSGQPPTTTTIKRVYGELQGNVTNVTFMGFFDAFATAEVDRRGYENAKNIRTVYNCVSDFMRVQGSFDWGELDLSFYNAYNAFLVSQGYTRNYIGVHWNVIKRVLKKAQNDGFAVNVAFSQFKRTQERVMHVYLTTHEIMAVFTLQNLPPYLERARDLFVAGCVTGLRFGDFAQLHTGNLVENGTRLKVKTSKTGAWVVIPVHRFLREIMQKYQGTLPRIPSNQNMNLFIKDIAKAAGINAPVVRTRTVGGKRKDEHFEKWQLVTTHTARRSFATNLVKMGVQPVVVMKFTGHGSISEFSKYVGFDIHEAADMLADHEFFKG